MDLGAILGHWCRKLAQSREFTLVIPGTSSALPSTTQHYPQLCALLQCLPMKIEHSSHWVVISD